MTKPELPKKKIVDRSTHVRRDTDVDRNISVTLFDIDDAIMSHMSKLGLQVEQNGEKISIPVLYGASERWKSAKEGGVFRDAKGKVQVPLIMFKRNSIAKNDNMAMLNRYVSYSYTKKYSPKVRYDKYSLMNGVVPTKQIYNVTMPDYVTLSYECVVWTDFVEHMNAIIEKIKFAADEYWGDPNRFRFRVTIDDFSNTTEVSADEDRAIKTDFTMVVNAYLLPKDFGYDNITQKLFSAERVIAVSEIDVTTDKQQTTLYGFSSSKKSGIVPSIFLPGSGLETYDSTNQELYEFLGLNKSIVADFVSENDSGFSVFKITGYQLADIPTQLSSIVSTGDIWSVYINGVKIIKTAVALEAHATGDLIKFDVSVLQYLVSSTDDVIVVGKLRSI